MGILDFVSQIFEPAAKLVDEVHTSEEEKLRLRKEMDNIRGNVQLKLIELEHKVLEHETKVLEAQQAVLVAEAQGKNWLQRNWRPLLMLVIVIIIANNYILFPYFSMLTDNVKMLELPPQLFTLLSVGVGGYVVGRSGEKIAQSLRGMPQISKSKQ